MRSRRVVTRCVLAAGMVLALAVGGCGDHAEAVRVAGCDDAWFRTLPEDPAAPGPWPVGARTVSIAGLTVEVWYPAEPGSEDAMTPVVYDIRESLPASERAKISEPDNPAQPCDCFRDLPIDTAYGPYPVVLFVHGTAGFRSQSLPQMVHWASRGFVVLAAEHPGLWLADLLGSVCGGESPPQDIDADLDMVLAAVRGETAGLEFATAVLDPDRIALAGHSAGGRAIADGGDRAQVIIPMAAGGVEPGAALASVLVLGGTADTVVPYAEQMAGYEASPAPKRLVGIDNAGHLAFSEVCALRNPAGASLLELAVDHEICGAQFASALFQCSDTLIPDPQAWTIFDHVTAAVLEQTLQCRDIGSALEDVQHLFPQVAEYREAL